jgi:predicted NAD/FAD-binding protein
MKLKDIFFLGAVLCLTGYSSAFAESPFIGPMDVNVVNVPLVEVANFPAQTKIPFSQDAVGNCNDHNCQVIFETVPEGKMLVIEHVSGQARPSLTTTIMDFAELATSNTLDPSIGVRHIFPMTKIGVKGDSVLADTWAVNAPVLAFVRAGSHARMSLTNRNTGVVFFAQATISGYLIDVD